MSHARWGDGRYLKLNLEESHRAHEKAPSCRPTTRDDKVIVQDERTRHMTSIKANTE